MKIKTNDENNEDRAVIPEFERKYLNPIQLYPIRFSILSPLSFVVMSIKIIFIYSCKNVIV